MVWFLRQCAISSILDAFEEARAQLEADRDEGADPEYPDEYRALNVFWAPPEARWSTL